MSLNQVDGKHPAQRADRGTTGKYILDEHGNPVPCDDLVAWANWFDTDINRQRVAVDTLPDDVRVSTVFLGIDHRFGPGAPLLFETMIFGGEHDGWQDRYSTKAEALAGHQVALAKARGDQ